MMGFSTQHTLSSSAPTGSVLSSIRHRSISEPVSEPAGRSTTVEPIVVTREAKNRLQDTIKEELKTQPMIRLIMDFMFLRTVKKKEHDTITESTFDTLSTQVKHTIAGFSAQLCRELKALEPDVRSSMCQSMDVKCDWRGKLQEKIKEALHCEHVAFEPSCYGHEETWTSGCGTSIQYGSGHYSSVDMSLNDYISTELSKSESADCATSLCVGVPSPG